MSTHCETKITNFFIQVASRDAVWLKRLRAAQFAMDDFQWCFTVPLLYDFLREQGTIAGLDYKRFRQILFASPINQAIRAHNAEIVIIDNQGKIDDSIYAMTWQPGSGGSTT